MKQNRQINSGKDKRSSKRSRLTFRQILFCQILVAEGLDEARRITKYSRISIWRILTRNEHAKEFIMSLFREATEKLGISYQQIMEERLDLARNYKTPASVRNEIYKDFINKFEDIEESSKQEKRLPWRARPVELEKIDRSYDINIQKDEKTDNNNE